MWASCTEDSFDGADEKHRSLTENNMSESQLLQIASLKAPDPLAFTAGSRGPRGEQGNEIVFSKNNVCVHPTELLPGQTEHCPGYLCVHTEEDDELGSTLILSWVPNSSIQRRDEEALRYITPEGSPTCRNWPVSPHRSSTTPPPAPEAREAGDGEPKPRQREDAGQGSFSVPADSTQGSDPQSGPSPSCVPPRSGALAERSGSALPDENSREMRDESVTPSACSTSSLSQTSPAPSKDSQSQSPRWAEQQNSQSSEPICGVFRMDLGQMRSLRLFFSDEACSSGQLVIASRENQFKILHFHHAGLDKLAEVFQQWKCCEETQLQDQVLDGRSCVQFSVLRPSPPSADAHPEEQPHRQLDRDAWLRHLSGSGQVEEQRKLCQAIFFGGLDPAIRGEVWPFLLRYCSWDSSAEERQAWRQQKRRQYQEIQQRRLSQSPEEHSEFWQKVQFTVDRDVVRTDCSSPFFRGDKNPNVEIMRRILLNYAVFSPEVGYSQGMSDLVAPLLTEVQDESDTFWCFVGLMESPNFIGSPHEENMEKHLAYLREMLGLLLPRFHQHLTQLGEDGLQLLFCHRWLLLGFRREFPDTEVLHMWEACWACYQTQYFHLFLCVAIVLLYGHDVTAQRQPLDQMLLHFSRLSMRMNGELVLRKARSLLYQFSLLPTIPCSLHGLCKLCGPGMWDSDCIPEAECCREQRAPQTSPCGSSATQLTPASPQPALRTEDKAGSGTLGL